MAEALFEVPVEVFVRTSFDSARNIRDWLKDHNIQSQYRWFSKYTGFTRTNTYRVYGFQDARDAMLFKLTWGGQ